MVKTMSSCTTLSDFDYDATTTIVLLPGLDGTGRLLAEFSNLLARHVPVLTLSYPTQNILDYDGLLDFIRPQLPQGDYIVVGESFSGPLALRLAQENPEGLKGVVLGASFARLDIPAKSVLGAFARRISPRWLPTSLLVPFLMGRHATVEWRERLKQVLATVSADVLGARLQTTLDVDLAEQGSIAIGLPVLYLQATEDRLMPKSAAQSVAKIAPHLVTKKIAAPHFLFQFAASDCAAAILNFKKALSSRQ